MSKISFCVFILSFWVFGCSNRTSDFDKIKTLTDKAKYTLLSRDKKCYYNVKNTIAIEGINSMEFNVDFSKISRIESKQSSDVVIYFKDANSVLLKEVEWQEDVTNREKEKILTAEYKHIVLHAADTTDANQLRLLVEQEGHRCGALLKER